MRGQAFALLCTAPVALLTPDRTVAYAPHSVVVPEAARPGPGPRNPFDPTVDEGKTSLPPLPARSGSVDEPVPDPHDAPSDAIAVPRAARAGVDDINYDVSTLPPPVAEARRRLIEAAVTGKVEALGPIFEDQRIPPLTANFSQVEDVVAHLRNQSGDPEGREILAILLELLEAGFVHVGPQDGGTFVWPYFAEVPLEELGPRHYVEVYRVLTSLDVEELLRIGRYTFFRIGISHDGRIRYISAGDLP
jgi:hypothetical protein